MCPRSKDRISISSSSKKIDGRSIRGKEAARGDTNRNLGRKAGVGGGLFVEKRKPNFRFFIKSTHTYMYIPNDMSNQNDTKKRHTARIKIRGSVVG